jgi:hypothetical protein
LKTLNMSIQKTQKIRLYSFIVVVNIIINIAIN